MRILAILGFFSTILVVVSLAAVAPRNRESSQLFKTQIEAEKPYTTHDEIQGLELHKRILNLYRPNNPSTPHIPEIPSPPNPQDAPDPDPIPAPTPKPVFPGSSDDMYDTTRSKSSDPSSPASTGSASTGSAYTGSAYSVSPSYVLQFGVYGLGIVHVGMWA